MSERRVMDARKYLEQQIIRHKNEIETINKLSETEAREYTPEERARIDQGMVAIGDAKKQISEIDDREAIRKTLEGIVENENTKTEVVRAPLSMGEAFVRSAGYKGVVESGRLGHGTRWSTGLVEIGQKLTDGGSPALNVEATTIAGGTLPLQPQVLPLMPPVETPLTVAALFGQGTATQNSLVYLEETSTTGGALVSDYGSDAMPASSDTYQLTSEGGLKPAAFIDFTKRTVSLDKIAAFLPIADEMMEDEPQIVSYINGRLQVFVRQAEEAYLLTTLLAAGIGATNAGGVGGTNAFDAIAAGIYKVGVDGGLDADSVVINPADFWRMATSKAGTTGEYFSGGPYGGPARTPWGLRAVVTNAIAAGSPVVGAFRDGATVWRKGGLAVEASNSHNDYFRRDLTALRAVERLGLAVYRPGAFQVCALP